MGETSNMFPVSWKKTLKRIKEVEEQDVLHDIGMPKWPRSKLVYLMFLLIYILVEFPASRLVLAYESVVRDSARTPGSVARNIVRMLVALIMLPLFVVVWIGLVTWNILHSIWDYIWGLGELKEKMDKQLLDEAVKRYVKAEEKGKEQDGGTETERKRVSPATQEEKSNKKEKELEELKELKERARTAEVKDAVAGMRRDTRQGKQDRVQRQVASLINPPRLYEAGTKGFATKKKENHARADTAASLLGEGEATAEIPDQRVLSEAKILSRGYMWWLTRGLKMKAIDEEVRVAAEGVPFDTQEV